MAGFLDDYEPVEDRLRKFWEEHPKGQITTDLLPAPEGEFIVRASVWRDPILYAILNDNLLDDVNKILDRPDGTGLAREVIGEGNVNKTSALENCETSAIGRALANLGYAAKGKRASREEMEKTQRTDIEQTGSDWLATAVQMFGKWDDDQMRSVAKGVMSELEFKNPLSLEQAKKVHAGMAKAYYLQHPNDEGAPF